MTITTAACIRPIYGNPRSRVSVSGVNFALKRVECLAELSSASIVAQWLRYTPVRHRILIVDDEQATLNLFSSVLKDRYGVETARSAEAALDLIRADPSFAVIVSDVYLPGMSGIDLLKQCAKLAPEMVRVSLTGAPDRGTVVDSVNEGSAFRFVSKPVRIDVLAEIIEAAVQRYDGQRVERDLMETTVRTSVNLLLEVLATLDPTTFELSQRVRASVRVFAKAMRLPNAWELELAASLARIGAVALPPEVVRKAGRKQPLAAREAELIGQIPHLGCQLLKQIPRLDRVAQAIRYQAKNFDGTGRPADTIARNAIPLGARLVRLFTDRALLELDHVTGYDAYRALSARAGAYDPALLESSFQHFADNILTAATANQDVRTVSAAELEPDAVLVGEIRNAEGMLLVASGTRLTPLIVQRVQTHVTIGAVTGPFSVRISKSDTVPPLPIPVGAEASA